MSTVNLESLGYGIDTDFPRSLLQSIALFRGVDADSIERSVAALRPHRRRRGRRCCSRPSARTTASTSC